MDWKAELTYGEIGYRTPYYLVIYSLPDCLAIHLFPLPHLKGVFVQLIALLKR